MLVVSPSFTFRTDVQRVQMPAKNASGRLSSNANQTGGRDRRAMLVLGKAGERHDAAAFDPEPAPPVRGGGLRIFVTPGSDLRPLSAKRASACPSAPW